MRRIGDLPDSGYSFKMGLLLVNKVREMEVKIKICKILTYVNQQLVYIRLGVQKGLGFNKDIISDFSIP
jgi:hypothetical protein